MKSNRIYILGLAVITSFAMTQCSMFASKPVRIDPVRDWERFFFPAIDRGTDLANIPALRQTALRKGEFEVRLWRVFSIDVYEGVLISFKGGDWTASRILERGEGLPHRISQLPTPKSGWEAFWAELVRQQLLELPNIDLRQCTEGLIDGTNLVVESTFDGVYRTYSYPPGLLRCSGSEHASVISDYVGIEFYDGVEKCTSDEWFSCASINRTRRLESEQF